MKDTDPSKHLPALSTPSQSNRCPALRDQAFPQHIFITCSRNRALAASGPENVMHHRPQGHFTPWSLTCRLFIQTFGQNAAQEELGPLKRSTPSCLCMASLITAQTEIRHLLQMGRLEEYGRRCVLYACLHHSQFHIHLGWWKELFGKTSFFSSKQNFSEDKINKDKRASEL